MKKMEEEIRAKPNADNNILRHQSSRQPTAADELNRLQEAQGVQIVQGQGISENGALNGFAALAQPIGVKQVQEASVILQKYKQGKANLEKRIVENEQWYKLRHWECLRGEEADVQPTSAWLFNCIANKHAEAMDNFPSPNILPREEGDKTEAKMLTSILPVLLDQCDFEQTYNDVQQYKLKTGTGVYGVFWDQSKHNGLGDISINKVDIINLFWEGGITDIQRSRNFFHVELADNDILIEMYPQLEGKLGTDDGKVSKYIYDDTVDTSKKSSVVDWYYKKNIGGKRVVHYVKYVSDIVLYSSENDPELQTRGFYDHGMYPFVFDALFPVEGTPAGFGYIDVGKSAQEYIDRGNQAIMQNTLANASPRYFIRSDGAINETEYADLTKPFVHVDGNLGQDSVIPVQGKPLNSIYVNVIKDKIDELKETTGNRDISTGGTTSGVTAASAIAALQEAGSKISRDNTKASYRAFRKICLICIELIRQFYDMPRKFRIMGEKGAMQYVQYSNERIKPQHQGYDLGQDMGFRLPLFDIEITAQKQSPYSKMGQNELAFQLLGAGFFNPQNADQSLACLEMMDFDRKDFVAQRISQNGTMLQTMQQMQSQMFMMAAELDRIKGTNFAQQMTAGMQGGAPMPSVIPDGNVSKTERLGGESSTEAANTKNARKRVAESTSPT